MRPRTRAPTRVRTRPLAPLRPAPQNIRACASQGKVQELRYKASLAADGLRRNPHFFNVKVRDIRDESVRRRSVPKRSPERVSRRSSLDLVAMRKVSDVSRQRAEALKLRPARRRRGGCERGAGVRGAGGEGGEGR